jgi:hypothetical protein
MTSIEGVNGCPQTQILATTAGDLPLEETVSRSAGGLGRSCTPAHPQSGGRGAISDRRSAAPAVWHRAVACRDSARARARRALGASVVQTDRNTAALVVCRRNAALDGVVLEQRAADWTAWHDTDRYDDVVGSDILYAESVHAQLRLVPGGRLLLADPFRPASFELLEAMTADDWNVTVNKWTVGIVPPPSPIGVFELTRRE